MADTDAKNPLVNCLQQNLVKVTDPTTATGSIPPCWTLQFDPAKKDTVTMMVTIPGDSDKSLLYSSTLDKPAMTALCTWLAQRAGLKCVPPVPPPPTLPTDT